MTTPQSDHTQLDLPLQYPSNDTPIEDTYKQRYKSLKERYRYIKRQNEMLADECQAALAKLNRLKIQKNLLLDDIIRAEQA
ncbi:uncharacterized protein SPPG_09059 [Spizellomyces punctatus DAOM BR117]|uniref:Uncharacterized protein n=1 Tax=Spizellomyces punctatus (strain DAOM BR117) TaxID=645134 RepID=A0A0L0HMX2_SPIPD|nr:uncharacterized protein SPPG_09059 [Spizellomyces punctatus DAOM BR117]KND02275.1 hypothetical protein SPPG_09059 [Spizellomyces punctatus DAOM BR117]|eukprot:XP_016610314.1 hypothetical protein SPPG_09059 [Spizellomyces punctatus DAOM BR117]